MPSKHIDAPLPAERIATIPSSFAIMAKAPNASYPLSLSIWPLPLAFTQTDPPPVAPSIIPRLTSFVTWLKAQPTYTGHRPRFLAGWLQASHRPQHLETQSEHPTPRRASEQRLDEG